MSALMPKSSRGFGINRHQISRAARDCTENVYGFPKNAYGFQKKCEVWYQDQQIQQEKVTPVQHFGKIPLEFLSGLCPQPSPCGKQAALPGATLLGQEAWEDPALCHAWREQESAASRGWGRRCHGQGSSRDIQRGESSWTVQGSHAPATKNKHMCWKTEIQRLSPVSEQVSQVSLFTGLMTYSDLIQLFKGQ